MVPIHESDVAENRWKQTEWSHIEFWEKIEVKLRRRKTIIILLVITLFLFLISIPVLMDRLPKWRAYGAMRRLTVLLDQVKLQAAREGASYRVDFINQETGPVAQVFKVSDCSKVEATSTWVYDFLIFDSPKTSTQYRFLSTTEAKNLGLERVEQSFCYDSAKGYLMDEQIHAIGLISVKDLTVQRVDRLSFVNIRGKSAEISFD